MITLASVAITMILGLVGLIYGQDQSVEEFSADDDTCTGDEGTLCANDNGLDITVNLNGTDEVISIPNGCVDYSDNFLDHAEVTVKKSWTWGGDTVECNWRPFVDYFMQRNYIVTLDGSTAVFMTGPPIIEDTGDSSSDNQRSEAGSEILENTDKATSNNSTEDYQNKYCPEYSDPDEHKLLVLCRDPEPEEPQDDRNR